MKRIYRFSLEHCDWPDGDDTPRHTILGGKGASLVMMCKAGLPVPPGFTLAVKVGNQYREYMGKGQETEAATYLDEVMVEVMGHMGWLKEQFGYMPLVSVRSGAPVSLPGMMDTILNVGMRPGIVEEWEKRIGMVGAYDSLRRGIQMLGSTAFGIPSSVFEKELAGCLKSFGVTSVSGMTQAQLQTLMTMYLMKFQAAAQQEFPDTLQEQLRASIRAVFDSWMNPRAIEYRKIHGISEDMGTAVTVQAMVFGNMGPDSGTGVLFTRDPSTGVPGMMGEFLQDAQGEDVVAGIRTPLPVGYMQDETVWPECTQQWVAIYDDLEAVCHRLEEMYRDMVDVEFTVQQGKLFVLQSRVGKREARAAFRIARDLVHEGVITRKEALCRLDTKQYKTVRGKQVDPDFKETEHLKGLPASSGVASGVPVFSAADAVNCTEPCVLITAETNPDDIAGMARARGILTQTGGVTSHAAVVARAMEKPCVVGCTDLDLSDPDNSIAFMTVTIDGGTGRVWFDTEVPVVDASQLPEVQEIERWCLEELGAVVQTETDIEGDVPQRIVVAPMWGDEMSLQALLIGLEEKAEAGQLGSVVLDIRSPFSLIPESDHAMYGAFDQAALVSPFWGPTTLLEKDAALSGLVVVGAPVSSEGPLVVAGCKVPARVVDMRMLLEEGGPHGDPSPEFMKFVGGQDGWLKLQQLFRDAGREIPVVPPGLPPAYAAFRVIGRNSCH